MYFSLMAVMHKTNHYLLAVAKVSVLLITLSYIYYRLDSNTDLNFSLLLNIILLKGGTAVHLLIGFFLLTCLNWGFEILKWKYLVSIIESISYKTAYIQIMASLTVSLATPNRIGEYGAKAFFYERSKRKKILFLTFCSNITQLFVTLIFGGLGIISFLWNYSPIYSYKTILVYSICLLLMILAGYKFKHKELIVKGASILNLFRKIKALPSGIKWKIFIFSLCRYVIFSQMFYGILCFFGAELSFGTAMTLIFTMYLLVSVVPTIFILDLVVRGGVAVWLFSFAGVSEYIVLSTVLTMWVFNFALPAMFGSFHVLTYQLGNQ